MDDFVLANKNTAKLREAADPQVKTQMGELVRQFQLRGKFLILQAALFSVILPLLYLLFATILWIWYWVSKDQSTITPVTILIGVGVFAPMILPIRLLAECLNAMWWAISPRQAEAVVCNKITKIYPIKTIVKGDPANKVEMGEDVYCLSYILSLKNTELINILKGSEDMKE